MAIEDGSENSLVKTRGKKLKRGKKAIAERRATCENSAAVFLLERKKEGWKSSVITTVRLLCYFVHSTLCQCSLTWSTV